MQEYYLRTVLEKCIFKISFRPPQAAAAASPGSAFPFARLPFRMCLLAARVSVS